MKIAATVWLKAWHLLTIELIVDPDEMDAVYGTRGPQLLISAIGEGAFLSFPPSYSLAP